MVRDVGQFQNPDVLAPTIKLRETATLFPEDSSVFIMSLTCVACMSGVPGNIFVSHEFRRSLLQKKKSLRKNTKLDLFRGRWSLQDLASSENLVKSLVFAIRLVRSSH